MEPPATLLQSVICWVDTAMTPIFNAKFVTRDARDARLPAQQTATSVQQIFS